MSFATINFRLMIDKNLNFNYFSGYYIRAFFYSTLRGTDPILAEKLHNSKSLSPFSSKALTIQKGNYRHVVLKQVNGPCFSSFGYSLFLPEISRALLEPIIQNGTVTLLEEKISLSAIEVREVEWADFINSSKPVKKFDLIFVSPTYFRLPPTLFERYEAKFKPGSSKEKSSYRYYPLPDPSLLLRSVAKIWKTFSPVKLNLTGLISWVGAGGVAISGFPQGIRTYRLYEHEKANKWVVGFTGRVGYSLPGDLYNEDFARNLDALLRFSHFSNVGGGRTAGLGMVEYIPLEYAKESEG